MQDTDRCPGRTQDPGMGTPGPRSGTWLRMGGRESVAAGARGQRGVRCFWERPALLPLPWGPRQPLPQPEERKGGEEPEGLRLSQERGQQLGKAPWSGQPWALQPVWGRARQRLQAV